MSVTTYNTTITSSESTFIENNESGVGYDILSLELLNTNDTSNGIYINDAYTQLLLHLNGTNGSTTFTDSSTNAYSITRYGTAALSTTQEKFGTSSLYVNGSSYIIAPGNFNMGTDIYTIELWFYAGTQTRNYPDLFAGSSSWAGNNLYIRYGNSGHTDRVTIHWNGYGDPYMTSTDAFAVGAWHHVAFVRENTTTLKLWVDGTLQATNTISSGTAMNWSVGGNTDIGGNAGESPNGNFIGYIDEIRVSKGIARYTAPFTPIPSTNIAQVQLNVVNPANIIKSTLTFNCSANVMNNYNNRIIIPNENWKLTTQKISGPDVTINANVFKFFNGGNLYGNYTAAINLDNWIAATATLQGGNDYC